MDPDWQDFLTQRGATIEAGVVQHFGNAAAELKAAAQGNVMCDLSQFGTLRVSGAEAQSFLQNLLSNDIDEVSNSRVQLSSLNTAKGRVMATMLIWRKGDDYLLQLPRALCVAIQKRLSMYVLRSKVTVTDASDEIVTLGLSGANVQEVLHTKFGELPQRPFDTISTAQGSVMKINHTRWQVNTSLPYASALWAAFSEHAQPVGSACWDWLNIRSGIPVILPQTQEQFVAQMVNLELIGGVSFKKGCYPGQEIVARTQYLGKLKRRMYLAHIDTSALINNNDDPQAGDELFSADMEGQASGMIVNAAPAPEGGYDVLASMQTSSQETQAMHWKSLQGTELQFLPLPYPLPET